jgi:multifunctional methyltransferase subunit TRM112
MKLLTHNMLTSKCLKGVNVGYPLGIVVSIHHVKDLKMLECMSEAFYVKEVAEHEP